MPLLLECCAEIILTCLETGSLTLFFSSLLKMSATQCHDIRPISPMQWKAFCKYSTYTILEIIYWKMWNQMKYVKSSVKLWAPTFWYLVVHQIWKNFWSKREIIGGWVKIKPVACFRVLSNIVVWVVQCTCR